MSSDPLKLEYQREPETGRTTRRDELAYILPMAAFLAFVWVGTKGAETPAGNTWYPWAYLARTVIVGALLIYFWKWYTRISWDYWYVGIAVGILGIVQWVGMQLFLQHHFEMFRPSDKVFNPDQFFQDPAWRGGFTAVRLIGAVLVVPVMEELFWRDYLWRQIIAPNDFKLAAVGEWDPRAFIAVSLLFAVVHGNWWLTSIVWATMVGALLVYTRSLGACIIAHATTNLLLGLWVLHTKQWSFW
jgi:CAAX prenyl protease-like protein